MVILNMTRRGGHESPLAGFCALVYRAQGSDLEPVPAEPVVLIVLRSGSNGLSFLVPPNLETIIHEKDRNHIESVLEDLLWRGKLEPEVIFQQLSSLSLGPILTLEVGADLAEFPKLSKISEGFVPLRS